MSEVKSIPVPKVPCSLCGVEMVYLLKEKFCSQECLRVALLHEELSGIAACLNSIARTLSVISKSR